MNESGIYFMEKDGAVKIPDKYKKMSHDEITVECARLTKGVEDKASNKVKKTKIATKTRFVI